MAAELRDFYRMLPYMSSHHPEIVLAAPNGNPVRVDVSVADLHLELWDAGVITLASCGGDDTRTGYIMFDTGIDLRDAIPIMRRHVAAMPDAVPDAVEYLLTVDGPIDPDEQYVAVALDGWRVTRNFDVGGAASWHFGIHFPGWCIASPCWEPVAIGM